MTLWDHLTPRNLLDISRRNELEEMGRDAKKLMQDGYAVDADRVLDDMNDRRRRWGLDQEMDL